MINAKCVLTLSTVSSFFLTVSLVFAAPNALAQVIVESPEEEEVIVVTACRHNNRGTASLRGTTPVSPEQLEAIEIGHDNWYAINEDELPSERDFSIDVPTSLPAPEGIFGYQRANLSAPSIEVDTHDFAMEWADLQNAVIDAKLRIDGTFANANLENSDLSGMIIDGDFAFANLNHAGLWAGEIKGDFVGANLEKSSISADIIDADFSYANLTDAELICDVEFADSNFNNANLTRTNFQGAIFDNVEFDGSNLSETDFYGATFKGEIFYEPQAGTVPNIVAMATVDGLENLTFENSKAGLRDLKNGFRLAGYGEQANILNYTIKRREREDKWQGSLLDKVDSLFQLIFFEYPVSYGRDPGRALIVMLLGILVFAVPYYVSLISLGSDGIWRTWNSERIRQDIGSPKPERLRMNWLSAVPIAIYFSMLSAFHIGWRDLNVGSWLSRLQAREYSYAASGWVRTVSGMQSLLSVYLLALWALSYFGQPFG